MVVWTFEPAAGSLESFERAYGPEGAWAELFRRCEGYWGTDLLRESDGKRYLTVDRWESRAAYERARASLAEEYAALDAGCAALTAREDLVGWFDTLD